MLSKTIICNKAAIANKDEKYERNSIENWANATLKCTQVAIQ